MSCDLCRTPIFTHERMKVKKTLIASMYYYEHNFDSMSFLERYWRPPSVPKSHVKNPSAGKMGYS